MDISKIQKINALAKELKKHGIVENMEQGAKEAEKYIHGGSKDAKEFNKLQEEEHIPEPKDENLRLRKIESTLNQQQEMIQVLQEKINEIIEEINKMQPAQKTLTEQKEEPKEEKQAPLKETKTKEENKSNPRSGNYNPSDVAIDKMFYFGTNKK